MYEKTYRPFKRQRKNNRLLLAPIADILKQKWFFLVQYLYNKVL